MVDDRMELAQKIESDAISGRIDLPGGWYLVRDPDETSKSNFGCWFLSTPDKDGPVGEGVWVAKFWDGPESGEGDVRAFASALLSAPATPSEGLVDESGWLLERHDPPEYLSYSEGFPTWTTDVDKALRFARRVDADAFSSVVDDAARVTEHMWAALSTPVSPARPPQVAELVDAITSLLDDKHITYAVRVQRVRKCLATALAAQEK